MATDKIRIHLQRGVDDAQARVNARNKWIGMSLGSVFFGVFLFLFGVFVGATYSGGVGWALGVPGWIFIIVGAIVTAFLFEEFDESDGGPQADLRRAQRDLDDHDFEKEI